MFFEEKIDQTRFGLFFVLLKVCTLLLNLLIFVKKNKFLPM